MARYETKGPRYRTDASLLAVSAAVSIKPAQVYVDVEGPCPFPVRLLAADRAGFALPGGGAWTHDDLIRRAARRGWTLRWGSIDPMRHEEDDDNG